MSYTEQDVLQYVEENDVKFIRLFFCDIFGVPKNVAVMAEALPRVFAQGAGFDVSAVDGFMNVAEGDLLLIPDPSTLSILPWRPAPPGGAAVLRHPPQRRLPFFGMRAHPSARSESTGQRSRALLPVRDRMRVLFV